jgi:hypothetical protein
MSLKIRWHAARQLEGSVGKGEPIQAAEDVERSALRCSFVVVVLSTHIRGRWVLSYRHFTRVAYAEIV